MHDGPVLYRGFRWGFDGSPQEMLVEDGRVRFRGVPNQVEASGAEVVDLEGRFVLPAFTDCHCHVLPTGLDLQKLNLGDCNSHDEVLGAVRDAERRLTEGDWLLAVHYDQTKYEGGLHLHRSQLDAISSVRPIVLKHVSGHASVANTAALRAAGVNDLTPDPEGGEFVRDASGALTGVLLERAHEAVTAAAPDPPLEKLVEAIVLAGRAMREVGISCASDLMTGRFGIERELKAYRLAAESGCPIRLRLYPIWSSVFGPRGIGVAGLERALDGIAASKLQVAGIKIFADGAIGAGTAAIYGPYAPGATYAHASERGSFKPPDAPSPERDYSGQLMYSPDRLGRMVREAHDAGLRVAIHAIGDFAADVVMDALATTDDPSRHRIEHAMILSDAQVARLASLGAHVSMQPEFLVRFAHAYRRQLGEERVALLKRFRSVWDAGVPLSLSSDRPIVSGDPWIGVAAASQRPAGFDPAENLTRSQALRAYTELAAKANGDQHEIGMLLPGQLADFNVYRDDPLRTERPRLDWDFGPIPMARART